MHSGRLRGPVAVGDLRLDPLVQRPRASGRHAGCSRPARPSSAEHDPAWADRFEVERGRLATVFDGRIERVGSTAVPGLAAKPIVDIAVAVTDPEDDAAFRAGHATALGYVLRIIEPGHRMFRTPAHDVHVHLSPAGGAEERGQLLFR